MPVVKNCLVCNQEFKVVPSHQNRVFTCSKECSKKYASSRNDGLKNGTSILKKCCVCSNEFKIHLSRVNRAKNINCCSKECAAIKKRLTLDNEKIKQMYLQGLNIYQIGDIFGVSHSTIQGRLKQEGIILRTSSENNKGSKNAMYGKKHTPEAIQKIKEANKRQWNNPTNREKHAILTAKQIEQGKTGKKNNTLEKRLEAIILANFKIEIISQYRVGRYVFDFFVPSKNLLIEADGTYWHSDPRFYPDKNKLSFTQKHNKKNDNLKNQYAKDKGYTLLRLWEHDVFNNQKLVIQKLTSAILGVI